MAQRHKVVKPGSSVKVGSCVPAILALARVEAEVRQTSVSCTMSASAHAYWRKVSLLLLWGCANDGDKKRDASQARVMLGRCLISLAFEDSCFLQVFIWSIFCGISAVGPT